MASNIKVVLEVDNKKYINDINAAKSTTEGLAVSADKVSARTKNAFKGIGASTTELIGKLKGLAAAYVGLETIKSAFTLADSLTDLSKATEISVQNLLALQTALALSGGTADKAKDFVSELQKKMYEASTGAAEAQENFLRLGFSFKDLANLTPEQALQKTITQLASMEDVSKRNALAQKLLGDAAKNIDWNELARAYEANKTETAGFAAAAERAGKIMDDITNAAFKLKVNLLVLLDPLLKLIEYFGKLTGLGDAFGLAFKAVGFIIKAIAIGAATLSTAIDGVVTDVETLINLAPAVWARDWDEAGKIIEKRNKSIGTGLAGLAAYIEDIDLFGTKAPEAVKPATPVKTGEQPAITAYYAKQVEALKKLSEAYDTTSNQQLAAIKQDTIRLQQGEDSILMMTALSKATTDYNVAIKNVTDQLAQLTSGPQNAASAAMIAQLEKERDAISATYELQLKRIPEAIKLKQQEITLSKQYEIQAAATKSVLEETYNTTQALSKIGKSPLEKQLIDIQAEAKKATKSLIDMEATRKFGQDYLIRPDNFIDPKTGAFFDKAMQDFADSAIKNSDKVVAAQTENATKLFEQSRTWSAGWDEAFAQYVDNATNSANQARSIFEKFTTGVEDAIVNFVQTGKLNFKDLANTLIAEFTRIQAKKLLSGLFGGGGGSAGSDLGSLFGGFFANGGTLGAGKWGIAGENGPEIIQGPATVTPMASAANVTYNINAVDAMSFRQMLAREPEYLYAVTEKGRSSIPGGRR